jgi:hypothetical protein
VQAGAGGGAVVGSVLRGCVCDSLSMCASLSDRMHMCCGVACVALCGLLLTWWPGFPA